MKNTGYNDTHIYQKGTTMNPSVAMAIVIKKHNRKKLGILTGTTPSKSAIGDIYVFPYSYDESAEILEIADFFERYNPAHTINSDYFTDVTSK